MPMQTEQMRNDMSGWYASLCIKIRGNNAGTTKIVYSAY